MKTALIFIALVAYVCKYNYLNFIDILAGLKIESHNGSESQIHELWMERRVQFDKMRFLKTLIRLLERNLKHDIRSILLFLNML